MRIAPRLASLPKFLFRTGTHKLESSDLSTTVLGAVGADSKIRGQLYPTASYPESKTAVAYDRHTGLLIHVRAPEGSTVKLPLKATRHNHTKHHPGRSEKSGILLSRNIAPSLSRSAKSFRDGMSDRLSPEQTKLNHG